MPRGGDALALLRIRARTHQAAPLSWSIDLGTRKPYDTAPLLEFACREARELRLCHDQRVNAHRCKPGLEISRLDDFVASLHQLLHDRRWQAGRTGNGPPSGQVESWKALLVQRLHAWRRR